jgi:hypothetical protein
MFRMSYTYFLSILDTIGKFFCIQQQHYRHASGYGIQPQYYRHPPGSGSRRVYVGSVVAGCRRCTLNLEPSTSSPFPLATLLST